MARLIEWARAIRAYLSNRASGRKDVTENWNSVGSGGWSSWSRVPGRLPPADRPAILGGMSGKLALSLFNCLIGSPLILGGLALAVRIGDRDPVAGFTL